MVKGELQQAVIEGGHHLASWRDITSLSKKIDWEESRQAFGVA